VSQILVLAAIDVEARSLARHLGLTAVSTSHWPHYRGGALEVACVGLRAARLAERATAWRRPTLVVSAGACGGLAPDLAAGALVVPEAVIGPDGVRFATAALPPLGRAGTLLTVADVVLTAGEKARLWIETGAVAVDMESAALLEWARAMGVAAAVVRAVSDPATAGVPPDLAALVEPGGRVSRSQALRAILARPKALADAIALSRGMGAAMKIVAAALGRVARVAGR
jgi:adenosylhomocysteine nucleosidase